MTDGFTPGAIVGRYEILRLLGAGGMAEVYLAQAADGERVAIKRLLPLFAHEPRFIEMFVAEAKLASTLHHPNIAKVFDVGVHEDECYFAMELVNGYDVRALSVAAVAYKRPMPLAISLSIMYGVTCALAYVQDPLGPHGKLNVVHRDISPSNILVSFDGAIKLVDFGIARVETGAVTRSGSGQLKGKIPYMSPEQCRARPLDGRSDLFSLGVVLYELTTQVRPFDRPSDFDTLEAIVRGEFVPPSRVVANYPSDVEPIIMRLLATRASDRYPSAGALLVDLDRVIAAHGLDLSSSVLAAQIHALLGRETKPIVKREQPPTPPRVLTMYSVPPAMPKPAVVDVPVDRIGERLDELLERIAPGTTDARDLSADAVAKLIGRAMRSEAKGDREAAVLALELALSAARPDTDALLAQNEALILGVFDAFIGDPSRMLAVSQHLEQLIGLAIDQRAAFLFTRIVGEVSVTELLATCGLPRREACRHLCQLMLRGLVVLV